MSSTPSVSVVIPTRQRPELLRRALRSVQAQTVRPIEVVVVGDGARPLVDVDLSIPVRVVTAPAGTGAGECRNIGARSASGEWVALLDDDDEWLPTKLERQLRHAEAAASTVVACRVRMDRPGVPSLSWPRRLPRPDEAMAEYLLRRRSLAMGETLVQTSMLLVRSRLLRQVPFAAGLARHQEWDWLLRVEAAGLLRLGFVETVESVWHSDDRASRITRGSDWRISRDWVLALGDLVPADVARSFLLTFVPRVARQGREYSAIPHLLAAGWRLGRPSALELMLFAGCWLAPSAGSGLGRRLRVLSARASRGGRSVAAGHGRAAEPPAPPHRRPSVLIVQPYVAGYRVALYEELRAQLAARGVALDVLVGRPQGQNAVRDDAVHLPWATQVPAHLVTVRGHLLRFKGRWRGPRPDLVILPHGSGWMDNYPVLARRRQAIGLWGQGRPYTTGGNGIDRRLERWQLARADHYFAYTGSGARSLTAAGWPAERVTVLNNTSDTRALRRLVEDLPDPGLAEPGPADAGPADAGPPDAGPADAGPADAGPGRLPARERAALFVGGLDAAKRLDFLVAAGDRVADRLEGFRLVVAGRGVQQGLVEDAARTRSWLSYVGPVDAPAKARLARASSVLLMPGRVGLVAVDSFALGLPVVTTAWPWHAPEFEYLNPGNSVVAPDDVDAYATAVCSLLTDGPRLARLAEQCRRDADLYSVEAMAARFADGISACLRRSAADGTPRGRSPA